MKYSNVDVSDVVQTEGLGYAVLEGIDADKITDKVLATLWEDAKELLDQIQEYLDENQTDAFEVDEDDDESYD